MDKISETTQSDTQEKSGPEASMEFTLFATGMPLDPLITEYSEGAHFNFNSAGYFLNIFAGGLRPEEIRAIQAGPITFGLLIEGPVIFLLCRTATGYWDAPYSWHIVPADERQLPPLCSGPTSRINIVTMMIEARTGIIKALRGAMTLSPEMTCAFDVAVRAQAAMPWNRAAYEVAVARAYERYPSPKAMMEAAAITCWGGH